MLYGTPLRYLRKGALMPYGRLLPTKFRILRRRSLRPKYPKACACSCAVVVQLCSPSHSSTAFFATATVSLATTSAASAASFVAQSAAISASVSQLWLEFLIFK